MTRARLTPYNPLAVAVRRLACPLVVAAACVWTIDACSAPPAAVQYIIGGEVSNTGGISHVFSPADHGTTAGAPEVNTQVDKEAAPVLLEIPSRPRDGPQSLRSYLALKPVIDQAAADEGIDPDLLAAVIDVESGFNARAVSPKGALGLMQLMPRTGASYGVTDFFNPVENIRAGAAYLANLFRRFGIVELALAAYNAGEMAVVRNGLKIPQIAETKAYVPRVMQRYDFYRVGFSPNGRL